MKNAAQFQVGRIYKAERFEKNLMANTAEWTPIEIVKLSDGMFYRRYRNHLSNGFSFHQTTAVFVFSESVRNIL